MSDAGAVLARRADLSPYPQHPQSQAVCGTWARTSTAVSCSACCAVPQQAQPQLQPEPAHPQSQIAACVVCSG